MTTPGVRVLSAAEAREDRAWTSELPNPYFTPAFLGAAAIDGPGGAEAVFLEAECGGKDVARWGILERHALGLRGAYAWDAPLIPEGADAPRAWGALLDALDARGNAILRMGCISTLRWGVEGPRHAEALAAQRGWRLTTSRFGTYVIDLTLPEETRWKAMDPGHRRRVRGAGEAGLTLHRLASEELDDYVQLSDETFARQGATGPSREYLQALMEARSYFSFYVARDSQGVAQSGQVISTAGGVSLGLHGGSGRRGVKGAGHWLEWETSVEAAAAGLKRYDFGGVDLVAAHGASDGIRDFKSRFGGAFEEHASMDLVFSPAKYALIERGRALANAAKRLVA